MSKRKPRRAPGTTLADLEKQYAKLGALLHASNKQDKAIREAAVAMHDRVNTAIAAIEAKLKQQLPDIDTNLAEQYARLLKQRRELQETITKDRKPITEGDHESPL